MPEIQNVLLVGNFLSSVGNNRTTAEEFAFRLRTAGYGVYTTSSSKNRFLRLMDMLWTVLTLRGWYSLAYVEVYSGKAFLWAELVCVLLRSLCKPYILALHGGSLPVFSLQNSGRVGRLLQCADFVTAPSRYLQEKMSIYRKDILLIPNPIDISSYSFVHRVSPSPHLVWLRAFHKIYNPSLAPRLLALLVKDFPDARLTMIGPDKGDGSLGLTQKVASELGVAGRISYAGSVPKERVPKALQSGDIFINTTNVDNTPVSVVEAMACGLCVVTTDVGGLPYLLKDGVDALLVPPDAPQSMANAVCRLLTESGLAEKLATNARCKAEGFDWSMILPQWKKLFLELSNKGNA